LKNQPYLLINKIQNYAWGSINNDAFIPQLLNFPAEKDIPYAELWIGTHPKACSEIVFDGIQISLIEAINKFPEEILGKVCLKNFGKGFPYLLKVLSAAEALSIQAHPDKGSAKKLHSADPVNYPDENHKPEIAIALDGLTALAGFRKIEDIIETINYYTELKDFLFPDGFPIQTTGEEDEKEKKLKLIFEALLSRAINSPVKVAECVNGLIKRISEKEILSDMERLFLELALKNPATDIGLLVIFFLEMITLKKGEAFFTGAGIPHAYIKGNIVECMANSDNVVRAGLTNKFKDVNALKQIAFYNTEPIEIIKKESDSDIFTYGSPADEFIISLIKGNKGERKSFKTGSSFEVALITEGSIVVKSDCFINDIIYEFRKGDSILIPASVDKYEIYFSESCEIYRVTII
jgi:mannose-6-phosphate isomerase